jgi:hypothetical protein
MATASVTSMKGGDSAEQEEIVDDPAGSDDSERQSSRLAQFMTVSSVSEVNTDIVLVIHGLICLNSSNSWEGKATS